jgi:hypothetical protein
MSVHYISYKNTNHQQMHKESFIINCNTLLHVSTLLGHLQGGLFCYRYTKVALYSSVRMCCWLCTGGVGTADSSRLQKQRSTQSTAHYHSTVKCNLSVTITKSPPWRWPSGVETCRSVLRLTMKLSLRICWWLEFLYHAVFYSQQHARPTLSYPTTNLADFF